MGGAAHQGVKRGAHAKRWWSGAWHAHDEAYVGEDADADQQTQHRLCARGGEAKTMHAHGNTVTTSRRSTTLTSLGHFTMVGTMPAAQVQRNSASAMTSDAPDTSWAASEARPRRTDVSRRVKHWQSFTRRTSRQHWYPALQHHYNNNIP